MADQILALLEPLGLAYDNFGDQILAAVDPTGKTRQWSEGVRPLDPSVCIAKTLTWLYPTRSCLSVVL